MASVLAQPDGSAVRAPPSHPNVLMSLVAELGELGVVGAVDRGNGLGAKLKGSSLRKSEPPNGQT